MIGVVSSVIGLVSSAIGVVSSAIGVVSAFPGASSWIARVSSLVAVLARAASGACQPLYYYDAAKGGLFVFVHLGGQCMRARSARWPVCPSSKHSWS